MDMFWLNHEQLLKGVNLGFQRYLSRQVKWDRRLIGIFGAKGVGKTTLLLQRIKLAYGDSHEACICLSIIYGFRNGACCPKRSGNFMKREAGIFF